MSAIPSETKKAPVKVFVAKLSTWYMALLASVAAEPVSVAPRTRTSVEDVVVILHVSVVPPLCRHTGWANAAKAKANSPGSHLAVMGVPGTTGPTGEI